MVEKFQGREFQNDKPPQFIDSSFKPEVVESERNRIAQISKNLAMLQSKIQEEFELLEDGAKQIVQPIMDFLPGLEELKSQSDDVDAGARAKLPPRTFHRHKGDAIVIAKTLYSFGRSFDAKLFVELFKQKKEKGGIEGEEFLIQILYPVVTQLHLSRLESGEYSTIRDFPFCFNNEITSESNLSEIPAFELREGLQTNPASGLFVCYKPERDAAYSHLRDAAQLVCALIERTTLKNPAYGRLLDLEYLREKLAFELEYTKVFMQESQKSIEA